MQQYHSQYHLIQAKRSFFVRMDSSSYHSGDQLEADDIDTSDW